MEQQGYDKTYYISGLRMRTRIQQLHGDPWAYELTPYLYCDTEPTDIVVKNQFEFDKVLAGLRLIELDPSRRFVNAFARLTGLEQASAWFIKRLTEHRPPAIQPTYRMRRLDAPGPQQHG
jgi:hypothetical protein